MSKAARNQPVTIWHNSKCSTSRKVLDMIRAAGVEPTIVDYVNTPPSVADIKAVLAEMGAKPRDLLRRRGTPYDELGLDDAKLGDAQIIAAMHEHPVLIERPVVRAAKGTRLCRPVERLEEIL
ncbi:MAG TPA: arsenate reductase (glutaredoxin) [Xanthobacteraceae bacterium]|jgi:arsenate reductase